MHLPIFLLYDLSLHLIIRYDLEKMGVSLKHSMLVLLVLLYTEIPKLKYFASTYLHPKIKVIILRVPQPSHRPAIKFQKQHHYLNIKKASHQNCQKQKSLPIHMHQLRTIWTPFNTYGHVLVNIVYTYVLCRKWTDHLGSCRSQFSRYWNKLADELEHSFHMKYNALLKCVRCCILSHLYYSCMVALDW